MNVVILNTHSVMNSGDAAIVRCQVAVLREMLDNPRITVTSRTPETDRVFYDRLRVQVLPPLFPAPSVFGSRAATIGGTARGLAAIAPKRRLLAELRGADVVISSGGGYFFSTRRRLPGPMFWQAYLQVRLAEWIGKPVVFAPQSIGPFANSMAARSMRRLLSHHTVAAILLREPVSLGLATDLLAGAPAPAPVRLCPDLAFLFDRGPTDAHPGAAAARGPHDGPAAGRRRPVLAVTVRDWLFPDRRGSAARADARTGYLAAVEAVCVWFHRRFGGSVTIVTQARGPGRIEDDRTISRELAAALRAGIPAPHVMLVDLPEDAPPEAVVSTLAGADLLLASRFHSAILAMAAGTPAIALGYQPKSVGMMRMLGLERLCLPMEGLEASRVIPLVEDVMTDAAAFSAAHVAPAVAAMQAGIRTHFRGAIEPLLQA